MNFSLLFLFSLFLSTSLVNCEVVLSYKFGSKEAKAEFKRQNKVGELEDVCVHWAGKVHTCGRTHLSTPKILDTPGYLKCINDISLPADFVAEISTMTKEDFISLAHFEDAYQKNLIKYVQKIDQKFPATHKDEETTLLFNYSIDFLAFAILIFAGVGVYLVNMKKSSVEGSEV